MYSVNRLILLCFILYLLTTFQFFLNDNYEFVNVGTAPMQEALSWMIVCSMLIGLALIGIA